MEWPHDAEGAINRELYSHAGDDGSDYDRFENENLADLPEYQPVVHVLHEQLRAHHSSFGCATAKGVCGKSQRMKIDDVEMPKEDDALSCQQYRYHAHSWETTCAIDATAPVISDALVALRTAHGSCTTFANIVPMVILGNPKGPTATRRFGGLGFGPGAGFGGLANETVPCTLHGNARPGCPLNGTSATDRKGGNPNGTAGQPKGSRAIRFSGGDVVGFIKACFAAPNMSRCPDLIRVPECAGNLAPTAFMGWEFTGVWWDHAAAELRAEATAYFSAFAEAGGELDEIVLDTEMIESHWARVVAPKMKLWYPNKKLPASYPTVSDRCARARWLAIQTDRRFPELFEELRSRGFTANTSHPEYLAIAMGMYTRAPVLSTYEMSDSMNQAVWNTVVSEKLAGFWSSALLDAGRKFFPKLRASNFDMSKSDPRWCIPSPGEPKSVPVPASAVADCAATAGGGTVGMQADDSYPTEYNSSYTAVMLKKHFGYMGDEYPLDGFGMMKWLVLHQKAHVLADAMTPIKPWIFPKSVCYAGNVCPLSAAHGGSTYYEEMLFQLALLGARGFYLFNPWFDLLSSVHGPRATMADYNVLSATLSELDTVLGCEGASWLSDGSSLRFDDGFILSAMNVNASQRVWRLTLMSPAGPEGVGFDARSRVQDGVRSVVNVSGVRFKLPPPAKKLAACNLLFSDASLLQLPNGSGRGVSKLGLWVTQTPSSGEVWLECGGTRFGWPRPTATAPTPPPRVQRYTCTGGLCVEFADGNSTEATCGGLCSL